MTEALAIAPETLDGSTPQVSAPPISEVPFHLTRRTLKQIRQKNGRVPERLWDERGQAVETKVQSVIASQTEIVKSVAMNPPCTEKVI